MRASFIAIAAGLALLGSGVASAQGYVGGAFGRTNISVDCSDTITCDKTSSGGKLYGGYMLGQQFSVELGYFDWGKASATGMAVAFGREAPKASGPVSIGGELKTTGFGLGVAYLAPLSGDWSAVLRAGIAQNKGKATIEDLSGEVATIGSVSKNSTQPYVGLGLGYKLAPNLVLTGEADFSRVKYGAEGVFETDAVRLISIGLRYSF